MQIKKCSTKGHQEKQIECISIQEHEILWACQYCVKENEKKYEFYKIEEIKQVIEKAKKHLEEDQIKEEFSNFEKKFQTIKNELNFYMHHLETEAYQQYKEVLSILDFVKSFNELALDTPNPIMLKNLQRILSNDISFSQSYQINQTQRYEEILKISAVFSQHIKSIQQRILDERIVQLVQQYNLPKQFQKQIEQDQTQDDHDFELEVNLVKQAGVKYCGYVLQGMMYGYGLLVNEKEKAAYVGNFIDDMFICGSKVKLDKREIFTGVQFEPLGNYSYLCHKGLRLNEKLEKHNGVFKNEVLDDENGEIVYINGDKYSGAVKNGQYHGYGSLQSKEFGILRGTFVNNKLNGQGELRTQDLQYEGEFKDNIMEGQGELTNLVDNSKYTSQYSRYIGQFVEGKKSGKGKLILSEEHEIEGNFVNDQPHGLCKEIIQSIQLKDMKQRHQETQLSGQFEHGKKQGEFEVKIVLFNDVIEKKMVYYDEDVAIYEEQL